MPGSTDTVMVIPCTRGLYSGTHRTKPRPLSTDEDTGPMR